jgi:hypothetical protein
MMSISELQLFVRDYEAAWNTLNPEALFALFDPDWPDPIYLPEENRHALEGYAEIKKYWDFCEEFIASVKLTVEGLPRAIALSDHLTLLVYGFHLDSALKLYAPMGFKPLGTDIRVFAISRRTSAGWRLIAYFEGSMGPMGLLRRLLESQVRPG